MPDYLGRNYICFARNINRVYYTVRLGKVKAGANYTTSSKRAEILWDKSVF